MLEHRNNQRASLTSLTLELPSHGGRKTVIIKSWLSLGHLLHTYWFLHPFLASGCHHGCATCDGIAKDNCLTCRDSAESVSSSSGAECIQSTGRWRYTGIPNNSRSLVFTGQLLYESGDIIFFICLWLQVVNFSGLPFQMGARTILGALLPSQNFFGKRNPPFSCFKKGLCP